MSTQSCTKSAIQTDKDRKTKKTMSSKREMDSDSDEDDQMDQDTRQGTKQEWKEHSDILLNVPIADSVSETSGSTGSDTDTIDDQIVNRHRSQLMLLKTQIETDDEKLQSPLPQEQTTTKQRVDAIAATPRRNLRRANTNTHHPLYRANLGTTTVHNPTSPSPFLIQRQLSQYGQNYPMNDSMMFGADDGDFDIDSFSVDFDIDISWLQTSYTLSNLLTNTGGQDTLSNLLNNARLDSWTEAEPMGGLFGAMQPSPIKRRTSASNSKQENGMDVE